LKRGQEVNRRSRSRRVPCATGEQVLRPALSCRRSCHATRHRRKCRRFWEEGFRPQVNQPPLRHEFFHDGLFRRSPASGVRAARNSPALLFKLGNSKFLASFLGGGCGVAVPLGLQLRFQVNFALAPLAFNDDPRGGRRGRGILWRAGAAISGGVPPVGAGVPPVGGGCPPSVGSGERRMRFTDTTLANKGKKSNGHAGTYRGRFW